MLDSVQAQVLQLHTDVQNNIALQNNEEEKLALPNNS